MNENLDQIFERIKNNTFTTADLNTLTKIIKQFLGSSLKRFIKDNLDDIISDTILSLVITLKNSKINIDNPEAYLRTIARNNSEKYEINHQETVILIRTTREILEDLEKEGIINSYNDRKYCLSNFNKPQASLEDVLNIAVSYDFTEINLEIRWTQKKKQLLKNFIITLLNDIECIEFSRLIDLLKLKLGFVMIKQEYEVYEESNENDDEIFEKDISLQQQQENQNIINEYIRYYREKLVDFIQNGNDDAKFLISIFYYYYIEEKSLEKIASHFGYNSPSTIQFHLKQNYSLTPNGFLKTLCLVDEDIKNHFKFVEELLNGFNQVLIDIYYQISQDVNNTQGDRL